MQKPYTGPFNLQPLFQKGVEKWFEKSGLKKKKFFKLGFFSGSRKVVDQKKGGFIL